MNAFDRIIKKAILKIAGENGEFERVADEYEFETIRYAVDDIKESFSEVEVKIKANRVEVEFYDPVTKETLKWVLWFK